MIMALLFAKNDRPSRSFAQFLFFCLLLVQCFLSVLDGATLYFLVICPSFNRLCLAYGYMKEIWFSGCRINSVEILDILVDFEHE